MSESLLERNHLDGLLEAMLLVPGLADSDTRDAWVEELGRRLRRPLDASRFADARPDLQSLIYAGLACSGGLLAFARIVHRDEANDASAHVVDLVQAAIGTELLSDPDRTMLHNHLANVPTPQMAAAASDLVEADNLRSLQSWRDLPEAIRGLENLRLPDNDVPQLLVFVDRLAHIVSEPTGGDLREWIETVAGGLGVDEAALAELRAVSARGVAGGRLSTVAPAQRTGSSDRPTATRPRRSDDSGLIWGGVPLRNRNFSGRVVLLDRLGDALRTTSTASVLPQTLRGMGGVGKTQLVLEYVYRHVDEYDIVWWIPSEQTSSVLSSLSQLAGRLGLLF